jgi:transcriptional regulator with XRE-family HTH domain
MSARDEQPQFNEGWRERLRAAIDRSGMKHSLVAMDARVTPETLSRILTAEHQRPSLDTITRIAHAVNENVGWVLGEAGFSLSGSELRELANVVRFVDAAILRAPLPHTLVAARPNAIHVHVRRGDVPRRFARVGARLVYQLTDDSLRDDGFMEGDLVYVRPWHEPAAVNKQLIACTVAGDLFVKMLDIGGNAVWLLSRNERFAPLELGCGEFGLIGVVAGRLGETGGGT